MKKYAFVVCFYFLTISVFAQEDAWVFFTDKPNVSTALANPITILTQKALDRKARHNVAIDQRDVPVNESYINQVKAMQGLTVLAKSKWFNAIHVRGTQESIASLVNLNFVAGVNFADKQLNTTRATNTAKVFQSKERVDETKTTVVFDYGNALNQIEMFNGHKLHEQGFTGAGITVAVLDAGFPNVNTMSAFSRLRDSGNLLGDYDFVDRDDDVYTNTLSNHGTLVLSDMAGFVENQFVGTAPDASYYLFITEDNASENPVEESYWVEAAERADSLGVDLINTSLGYKNYAPNYSRYSYSDSDLNGETTYITQGANIAVEKGLFLVVSAGNSGNSGVGAPADSPNVLSVGAVDASGNYASFSSVGSAFQPTQKPDVVAQGRASFVITENDVVSTSNGTSFSSPILAGGVACLMQALPNTTNLDLLEIIRASGSLFTNPNNQLGFGIPNLESALNLTLTNNDLNASNDDIILYPNPTSKTVFIRFNDTNTTLEQVLIRFVDALGKTVLTTDANSYKKEIDVSALASGVYFVQVETKNLKQTFRFFKS